MKFIREYREFINEMALKQSSLNKLDFYLNKDLKSSNPIWTDKEILKFREEIKNIRLADIKLVPKYHRNNNEMNYYFHIDYNFISRYKEFIESGKLSDSLYRFYFRDSNFITIELESLNRVHFLNDLPYVFRGCKLGFKIYLKLIFEIGYISSVFGVSADAKRIWKYLIQNKSLYHILFKNRSGLERVVVIDKNISDENFNKFKEEFGGLEDKDIISIDKELEDRINN